MVSALLMLERALRGGDAENGDAEVDRAIIDQARSTVREILEDAELRLWALEDQGWLAPEDDSAIGYAARLLLLSDRLDELVRAIRLAQEITFVVRRQTEP